MTLYRKDPGCTDGIPGDLVYPEPRLDDKIVLRDDMKTLELSWKDNERGCSCVPAGEYRIVKHTSGRFLKAYRQRWVHHDFVPMLQGPALGDRTFILIHSANQTSQLRGCIAVGLKLRCSDTAPKFLGDSRAAYARLWDAISKLLKLHGGLTLRIEGDQVCEVE